MQATMPSKVMTNTRRFQVLERPWTTYLLLLSIIVALFGEAAIALQGMDLHAFLHAYGLVSADFSWADPRSYLTLLTFNFLHSSARHFAGNAFILLAAGAAVEKYAGWRVTLLIWMAGGAVSGVAHLLVFPDTERTLVGASGAIAALLGAALVLGWKWALPVKLWPGRRTLFHIPLPLVTFIWVGFQMYGVVQIYSGAVSEPSIATWVHMAGFMFGACAAGVLQVMRTATCPVAALFQRLNQRRLTRISARDFCAMIVRYSRKSLRRVSQHAHGTQQGRPHGHGCQRTRPRDRGIADGRPQPARGHSHP